MTSREDAMRNFGDYLDSCPKCGHEMGADAPHSYAGSADYRLWEEGPQRLEIECTRCNWAYWMRPKDMEVPA